MMNGIDISHHNKRVVGKKLFNKVDFVMMKASEGTNFKDPMLDEYYNIIHGKKDGKPDCYENYGFYHFARPDKNKAIKEAKYFLSLVKHHAGYAAFALDWEQVALKYSASWAKTWLDYVYERTGTKPLIYLQSSELKTNKYDKILKDYPLWVAHWDVKNPETYGHDYAIWQNGIEKFIDRNIFKGTTYNWNRLAGRQGELINKISVGDRIKLLTRTDYNGVINAGWVMKEIFTVGSIRGDRVVVCKNGLVTGAWHITDVKLV